MLKINLLENALLLKPAQWNKLLAKSLHTPGMANHLARNYVYEPVVSTDGVITVPLAFPYGNNYVLVEKPTFVAVWGNQTTYSRFSPNGQQLLRWFRYYFEAEAAPKSEAPPPIKPTTNRQRGVKPLPTASPVIHRLMWNQLSSRLQHEVMEAWKLVAPTWMQEPERIGRYRPGLLTSGKRGKTTSVTIADIIAADPTAVEIDDVVIPTKPLREDDIIL